MHGDYELSFLERGCPFLAVTIIISYIATSNMNWKNSYFNPRNKY